MDPSRIPKRHYTPVPMTREMAFDPDPCDFVFNKSVKIQDQDRTLRNSILKLPKIKKDFQPTPKPQRKVDIQEISATNDSDTGTSSGCLLSLEDGIDIQTRIDLHNAFQRVQELKERQEAALRKSQKKKKPRPTNAYARDVQNWRDKWEKTPSKTLLQIDRNGQKPLNLSTDVNKFRDDKLRACPQLIVLSNEDSGKDKHDKPFKKSSSCKNEQKLNKQVSEKAEKQFVKPTQTHKRVSEGKRSEYVHDEREKNVHEKIKFQEKCKKMAYDDIKDRRRQEYIKEAFEEKKLNEEMTKQEFAQKLLDKQEKKKKVKMQKYLTDAWDDQVEYKRHKQIEMDTIIRQGSDSLVESEWLHRTEDVEKKKQKKKQQKLSTQDKTEQNMRDQKKIVDDNLEDILRKEAAYDSRQKKLCNSMAKEEVAKMLHEAHQQEKETPKQKPLADKVFASYENKQKQKREMDRTEREGVLPGYRAEEIEARRQKKDPQQKLKTQDETKKHMDNLVIMQWEMHHSVTEQERDVPYESGFLDYESDCNIPDKDRSHEICKKIVYDQLSIIKKEEAKKRALMEDKLMKEKKQQEYAEQKREKLEKEKKAAAMKSLILGIPRHNLNGRRKRNFVKLKGKTCRP